MITILNLSRREQGINDTVCDLLRAGLAEKQLATQYIKLRELTIGYCNNCRSCMKAPGKELGRCPLNDDMDSLVTALLQSKAIILSAPINCYDLPSILRVVIERMAVFCYWPDDSYSPKVRELEKKINGILITTSALPGVMVPIVTSARKTFRLFAKPIGIKRIDYFHMGFKGRKSDMALNEKDQRMVRKIIGQLAASGAGAL